jgi:hypothetical protein
MSEVTRNRPTVTTTVDKNLYELAKEKGIRYSKALDVGLKLLLEPYLQTDSLDEPVTNPERAEDNSLKTKLIHEKMDLEFKEQFKEDIISLFHEYKLSTSMIDPFSENKTLKNKISDIAIKHELPRQLIEFLLEGLYLETVDIDHFDNTLREEWLEFYNNKVLPELEEIE